jgi:hypothetical protein
MKKKVMKELALNRKQLGKLAEIYTHFKEVEWFTIRVDHSSGIGEGITVSFNLFNDDDKDVDTKIDITDVSTW